MSRADRRAFTIAVALAVLTVTVLTGLLTALAIGPDGLTGIGA
jgi:hypothetical protein